MRDKGAVFSSVAARPQITEEEGFMTFTMAHHQGAIETFGFAFGDLSGCLSYTVYGMGMNSTPFLRLHFACHLKLFAFI